MSGEQEDLEYLAALLPGDGLRSPGDDAALIEAGGKLLVTTDSVVEGIHFPPGASATRIAAKLLHRNLSDLAAMAAEPKGFVAAFVFGPGWPRVRRRRFYRALALRARSWGLEWVGGDLSSTEGPAVLSLTLWGRPPRGGGLRRSGLRPGDLLHVSGRLGGAPYGGRHLRFRPRVALARKLCTEVRPRAMMDLSDGLAADLPRMLRASGALGALLEADALPVHPDAWRSPLRAGPLGPLAAALGDGEDYELLVGLSPERSRALRGAAGFPPVLRRPIGRVVEEPGLRLRMPGGEVRLLEVEGWEHGFE